MNRRVYEIKNAAGPGEQLLYFHCPGCQHAHAVISPRWTWNGSLELPTFTPSILSGFGHDAMGNINYSKHRCHSFVKDGKIQFLNDCFHDLKNQTVDLPSVEHMYEA